MVLCMVALVVAQAVGGPRGYVCLCGSLPVPTQTSHCHGPHGEDCHADDATADVGHQEEGAGPRKEHQLIGQDERLRPTEAAPQVIAPQVPLAVLPNVPSFWPSPAPQPFFGSVVGAGDSPPFGVTVARTIVLRI